MLKVDGIKFTWQKLLMNEMAFSKFLLVRDVTFISPWQLECLPFLKPPRRGYAIPVLTGKIKYMAPSVRLCRNNALNILPSMQVGNVNKISK